MHTFKNLVKHKRSGARFCGTEWLAAGWENF